MISPDYLLAIDIYYTYQDTMRNKKIIKESKKQQSFVDEALVCICCFFYI